MSARALIWLWLCLLGTWAHAADEQELAALLQSLPAVGHDPLAFREYRHSSLFQEALVLEGRLRVDEAGALVKELTAPVPEKMVIGSREFSMETPGRSYRTSLSRSPFLEALANGLRGLLNRDARSMSEVFEVELERQGEDWRMTLRPRQPALNKHVDRMEVAGCTGNVSVVSIHTHGEEWQEMIFLDGFEACAR